jgi:hypothetical protein
MEPTRIYTGSSPNPAEAWSNVNAENKNNNNKEATPAEATPGKAATDNVTPGNGTGRKAGNGASSFDWVTQRSSCSLPKVFNTLRLQVEEDVKTRNSLRPNYSPYEFSLTEDTTEFSVLLKAKELQKSVTFSLADNAIKVRDDQGAQMFEVTLAFDDTGNCRLNVNAQERDFWQVRRMALEDLMYRGL